MSQEVPPDLEIPTLTQTLPGHWRTRPLEIPWITERAPKIDPSKPAASPLALDSPDAGQVQLDVLATADDEEGNSDGEALSTNASVESKVASASASLASSSSSSSPSSPSLEDEISAPESPSHPAQPTYASGGIQSAALQSQEADIARWVSQVIQATALSKTQGEISAQVPQTDALADEVVERVQARLNHMLPNLVQEVMDEIHQNPSPRGKPSDDVEMK